MPDVVRAGGLAALSRSATPPIAARHQGEDVRGVSSPVTLPDLHRAELPLGWRLATLDDACEFLDQQRIPSQPDEARRISGKRESDLYPYYGAWAQVGWIDDYLFDEPLILFVAEDGADFGSQSRPIAYAVTGRYWVNNHAHVLRPKPGVDFDFLLSRSHDKAPISATSPPAQRARN